MSDIKIFIKETGINPQGFRMFTLYAPIKKGSTINSAVAKEDKYCNGLRKIAEQWCKFNEVEYYFNENGVKVHVTLS